MRELLLTILLAVATTFSVAAQSMPERGEVRRGNRLFDKEEWQAATEKYTDAITHSPTSFEANYNLSNAYQKAEDYARAEAIMTQLSRDSLLSPQDRADVYYNLGNSQFNQQKYKEALESYKSSMRLNHADTMAKYNYAYTKLMLQQQQENQDEENQDDQQNEDDQQQQEQQDEQQEQQQEQQQGEEEQQGEEPQPQDGALTEQQLDQILDAIQDQEDKTQEKIDKEKGQAVIVPGGKNW